MDSISQAALGSVVALAVTGCKRPRQAIIAGALLGTAPDLDVLVPFESDLHAMIGHRTWSHSWLVHLAVGPLIALILSRVLHLWTWARSTFLTILVLITHSGLDALTVYGTWLFWPYGQQPIMGGSIFIIDPLYTIPLLAAVVMIWRKPDRSTSNWLVTFALITSSVYLCWGLYAKQSIENLARAQITHTNSMVGTRLVATPTPFNSILWRIIVIEGDTFREGFYSFLDKNQQIRFTRFARRPDLASYIDDSSQIRLFENFNHGFYALSLQNDEVLGQDLRMGSEPYFFFQFRFAKNAGNKFQATRVTDKPMVIKPLELFSWLGKRLINENLAPLYSHRMVDDPAPADAE